MRESDLDFVMEIERSSFSTPWSRTSFRNLLARSDAHLWVAVIDGEIVGYAVVWHVLGEAELGNLAVARSWRRLGLGQRLLDWVLAEASGRGAQRVYLEVRESNETAGRLYERRGFRRVGRRRRYYRAPVEDARIMCLELGDLE
jgi:ribosomal-protein-alanine N-acetyltransferase